MSVMSSVDGQNHISIGGTGQKKTKNKKSDDDDMTTDSVLLLALACQGRNQDGFRRCCFRLRVIFSGVFCVCVYVCVRACVPVCVFFFFFFFFFLIFFYYSPWACIGMIKSYRDTHG
ncbi:hypothetical protein GGR50DRAFT_454461 [Xylaria sp. CBS 124048]|nr:hypothetical protein GGR50DRAFT_454461 [Xylaria sp. CBS 124048]